MTLLEVEHIVKKNCIIDYTIPGVLRTNIDIELSRDIGQITFIAIARLSGLAVCDVTAYLSIKKSKYDKLLGRYLFANKRYGFLPVKQLYEDVNVDKKIVSKVRLIINSTLYTTKQTFISLDEFGY